ncbi:DUF6455 family protein [Marivita geojedonensis]|uniref:DUF6455 domain-containing protein n=1 Tax=Marivita geojedonensis TaxID=1123756 RepID=A0A1X4NDS1_9RHOB|nr:DUF6455 family protein [Marivita geojedonensis]OSQ44946.1 hypothetical protein MGEO_18570 [Marivita geojedonensis]PRY73837.1 hypothetical protein CLV76_12715 [Marivita geojedonensis]
MTEELNHSRWRPLGDTGVHFWLVQRMAKTCGVNTAQAAREGDIVEQEWVDMVQRCRSCQWVNGCERWLDRTDIDSSATPPADCLNADLLHLLSKRQNDGTE